MPSLNLSQQLSGHQDWVYGLAVSADSTRLASGSADGIARVWLAPAKPLATVVQLAVNSDEWAIVSNRGIFAASAESQKTLRWELTTPTSQPEKVIAKLADSKRLCDLLNEKPAPVPPVKPPTPPATGGPARPAGTAPGPASPTPKPAVKSPPTSKPDATGPAKKAN
jgi:WD40 repeat protein